MDFDKNDRKRESAQTLLEKQYGGARDGRINDDQIAEAFKGYNFGDMGRTAESRRKGVARAVLKLVSGYSNGRSMGNILQHLGLTRLPGGKPTKAAAQWMYHEYHPFGGD